MVDDHRSALLVVDVQKDFCFGGALPVPNGDRVVPVLNRYIADATTRRTDLCLARLASPGHQPFQAIWRRVARALCSEQRWRALSPRLPRSTIVISKGEVPDRHGYSAFEGHTPDGETFITDLQARKVDHLFVGGLATDYCVEHSVVDALRAGVKVTVLRDATAGVDARAGDSDRAIARVRNAGAEI